MRLFRSDADPEAYADELWRSLRPARPLEGCPGSWELKGPPGERGRWLHFGVKAGEALARSGAVMVVQIRRHDEGAPSGAQDGNLLLRWVMRASIGISIHSCFDAVVAPALPGDAASLIVTVWGRGGRLVEDVEVRAR